VSSSDSFLVPSHFSSDRLVALERRILQVLCNQIQKRSSSQRSSEVSGLADYSWQSPEHRVVFAAWEQLRRQGLRMLRDQLPAQATRMGFPDVDWAVYLHSRPAYSTSLHQLIRQLKAEVAKRNESAT
jgi:hypothetical protein